MPSHDLMGGRLHVYKRDESPHWQCSTYLAGKNWRMTTRTDSLEHAKEIAEDWYLGLRGKSRAGQLKTGKTFKEAVDTFLEAFRHGTSAARAAIPGRSPRKPPAGWT